MIVNAASIRASTYNPRKADARRLELVELSLRKLGWLLPMYVAGDEILSGHQRHFVAVERLGARRVPIRRTKDMTLEQRKAVNIAFNRGTNDLHAVATPATLTEAIERSKIYELVGRLPDLDLNADAAFRCEASQLVPVSVLTAANSGRWIDHAAAVARSLAGIGIEMPVVATPDGRLVNGLGRLQVAAEEKQESIEVVSVTPDEAPVANAFLNLLSMDFDLHTRYADSLRYNSFRRPLARRKGLGLGFLFDMLGPSCVGSTFDIRRPTSAAEWRRHYGTTVLDFGAGLLTETELLCGAGVDCVPFEPFSGHYRSSWALNAHRRWRKPRASASLRARTSRSSSTICDRVYRHKPECPAPSCSSWRCSSFRSTTVSASCASARPGCRSVACWCWSRRCLAKAPTSTSG